ncbi:MAG: NAD/NADP octopine/nopaline dehydrogenase family protein [Candidatus Cloacimonadaceae bacterium]|jgi:hypothetical protein|nr:NAD/NADP octopine/nopaline dehydrogenase family protein [Candidatus Cloacimonadota bacterium]MDX9948965.1 NAD/NADP octopine/nopaline dehydrogenase family protein [Candidatus Syntrophosphaera sp.]
MIYTPPNALENMNPRKCVGICGVSTQSGMAFLADLLTAGHQVYGYARATDHGRGILKAIQKQGGIWLERPPNTNDEPTRFETLGENSVGHDLDQLVAQADVIIIPVPSHYHLEVISKLAEKGLGAKKTPLVLAPSRTCAAPYIWQILGDEHPILCLATSPYSSKTLAEDRVLIKRRKRTFMGSLEGSFHAEQKKFLRQLFPQAAFSEIPGLTSLNNIGAVFHPASYLLNLDAIEERAAKSQLFSFYMEGIAERPEVGEVLEEIDQVRLQIAATIGLDTFGLRENPREDVWRKLMNGLRALEQEHENEIDVLRRIRRQFIEYINSCVISAQHWLDITYGVQRLEGEALSDAIGRTPTYQKNSYPQSRYIHEDVPTGLVPLEALALRLGISCPAVSKMIDIYSERFSADVRDNGRNLHEFSTEYLKRYLVGNMNENEPEFG